MAAWLKVSLRDRKARAGNIPDVVSRAGVRKLSFLIALHMQEVLVMLSLFLCSKKCFWLQILVKFLHPSD